MSFRSVMIDRMLDIPAVAFWILLFLGRDELGLRGIAVTIAIWLAALVTFRVSGIHPAFFISFQALMDVVLVLIVFKGDVKIR